MNERQDSATVAELRKAVAEKVAKWALIYPLATWPQWGRFAGDDGAFREMAARIAAVWGEEIARVVMPLVQPVQDGLWDQVDRDQHDAMEQAARAERAEAERDKLRLAIDGGIQQTGRIIAERDRYRLAWLSARRGRRRHAQRAARLDRLHTSAAEETLAVAADAISDGKEYAAMARRAEDERDAARAEVERLRTAIRDYADRFVDGYLGGGKTWRDLAAELRALAVPPDPGDLRASASSSPLGRIPAELKAILDQAAGRDHSLQGPVMACLADILERHEELIRQRMAAPEGDQR